MRFSLFLTPEDAPAAAPAAPPAAPAAPAVPENAITRAVQAARENIINGQPIVTIPEKGQGDGQGGNEVIDLNTIAKPTETPADEQPAEGVAEGLAPEEPAAETTTTEEQPEQFTLRYPARNTGEPDLELVTTDREEFERHQQLVNGYTRGMELQAREATLDRKEDDLAVTEKLIQVSPVAFVQDYLDPANRTALLRSLLTDPEVVNSDEMKQEIAELLNNDERAARVKAEVALEAERAKQEAARQVERGKVVQQNVRDVLRAITECVPPGTSGELRTLFINDSRKELAAYAKANRLTTLDPRDVPLILKARIQTFGGNVEEIAARVAARTRRAAAPPVDPAQPRPRAAAAQPTGAQLVEGRRVRKAGAVVAPAGTGSPPAGRQQPPKGQTIKQRADWAREHAS